jgi:NCAIR mutase (PurE)-related protein
MQPYDDMDFAKLDTARERRTGRGEVVFALGKTPEQVVSIMRRMVEHAMESGGVDAFYPILATKAGTEHFTAVSEAFTEDFLCSCGLIIEYNELAGLIAVRAKAKSSGEGKVHVQTEFAHVPSETERTGDKAKNGLIAVVSGGTADMPVAEEAAVTAEIYGHEVTRIYDVGVAGLHRLLDRIDDIRRADVIIVVAGMEGALASVLSGLVYRPVVAVPTSIGYGITLSGLTPLFAMLGSCSLGIGVMNIDNGFGAAHYASMILDARI